MLWFGCDLSPKDSCPGSRYSNFWRWQYLRGGALWTEIKSWPPGRIKSGLGVVRSGKNDLIPHRGSHWKTAILTPLQISLLLFPSCHMARLSLWLCILFCLYLFVFVSSHIFTARSTHQGLNIWNHPNLDFSF